MLIVPSVTCEIGVIGGTGLYKASGLTNITEHTIDTPFGPTSSKIVIGQLHGQNVAFIARHDVGHRLTPTEVPFRANIWALKLLGVKYLISFGAVGSLTLQLQPTHFVIVDQFIDRTKNRDSTFFGNGVVGHVSFGDPVCGKLSKLLKEAVDKVPKEGVQCHMGGTYVCMEGPAFSTRAESKMYQQIGGTVIGMTCLQEAKLAREAEIAFGCVAMVTDYDCWYEAHGNVTVEEVYKVLTGNAEYAQLVLSEAVKALSNNKFVSEAHSALSVGLMTPLNNISKENQDRLGPIINRFFEKKQ
ncbi:5'-methylthioadenosine phosphorylase [Acrasis kona]|uniref:S-methyl-5'-thioadenosine phosphorylase n=1 Tax=Acrasis kona TaxID=1008807 RepID=A0AAW2ZL16_9EUKA